MATTSENSIDNFLWSDSSILSSSGLLFFGHLLKTLKQNCKRELYNEVIPFWIEHGVDADLGGFICGLHHDGTMCRRVCIVCLMIAMIFIQYTTFYIGL